MTSDLDIYRAANELIKQHGGKAPIHAAMRADELLEAGAMEGKAVWVRIAKAVEELLSDKQTDGAANRSVFPSGAPSERGTTIGRGFPSPNWPNKGVDRDHRTSSDSGSH